MKLAKLETGTYVVAVSGGVDSVVLLHLLAMYAAKSHRANAQHLKIKLIVAHYDHGIRKDSAADRKFVKKLAEHYGLPFIYDKAYLGENASEAKARTHRYKFLNKVKKISHADAIITAHHEDDLLETAIINMSRGTSHKGLSALTDKPGLLRPLLSYPKQVITEYAKKSGLTWREDSTNSNTKYLRNFVRLNIIAKLSKIQKRELLEHVKRLRSISHKIGQTLDKLYKHELKSPSLERRLIISMDHALAREFIAVWLRGNGFSLFDKKMLERIVRAAKTASKGKNIDIDKTRYIEIKKDHLTLVSRKSSGSSV